MKLTKNIYRKLAAQGALMVMLLTSCELVVDVDLPEFKPSLVINSVIHPDTTFTIDLSTNRSILDSNYDFPRVSGATLSLHEDGTLKGTFSESNDFPGRYTFDAYPSPGATYKIVAEKSGLPAAEAQAAIPLEKTVAEIGETSYRKSEYDGQIIKLNYTIDDPKGEDFYEVKLYVAGYYRESYYDEEKDTVILGEEQRYLSEWYYWTLGANVNEFEDTNADYIFDDELFDGQKKRITIEFDNLIYHTPDADGNDTSYYTLQIRRLAKDYYRYLITSNLQYDLGGNGFSEPVQVYSNIKNGYGIFGAYQTTLLEFALVKGERVK